MTTSTLGTMGVASGGKSSPFSAPASSSAASPASSSSSASGVQSLTPSDFISMMVTQLQNQDPLQPTSNSELLAQMSQIGQLQSSTQLTSTLQGMTQQSQISSGASLIGKTVTGLDGSKTSTTGVVNSISVVSGNVNLQLDNGDTLPLGNVTSVSPGPSGTTAATPNTTPATTTTLAG